MIRPHSAQSGFTLLEIMVASVILIASIAAISLSFRGALLSSQKAETNLQVSGAIEFLTDHVTREIRAINSENATMSGKGILWGISYKWQAELAQKGAAPERFDIDSGNFVSEEARFKLWMVTLELSRNGVNKSYSFYEVSWNEQ